MQQNGKEKISIIGQCFNEEEALIPFYQAMCKLMEQMDYVDFELIFIDDCSRDRSLEVIKDLAAHDRRVRYISMSRNFGKDPCAMAGFRYATGDYVTTMDLDMEDPPKLLSEMYYAIKKEGYDIAAVKTTRHGYTFMHKFCVKAFYKLFNRISSVKIINGQRDYRLMKRNVISSILQYGEYNLFNKGILNDIGYKIKWMDCNYNERSVGKSKFPYARSIKYAVAGLLSYSIVPLICILFVGCVLLVLSLCLVVGSIIATVKGSITFFHILITLMVSLNTIELLCIGIAAMYIAQIHKEVKRRPRYIVRETNQSDQFRELLMKQDETGKSV